MKKFAKKALSTVLALVMCAGMVAPAFAASFADLQNAIDGKGGEELSDGSYGYAKHEGAEGEAPTYGITAKHEKDADGKITKSDITLHKDVTYGDGMNEGQKDKSGIKVGNSGVKGDNHTSDVTIDLNGHDIDLNPDAELKDGQFVDAQTGEATTPNSGSVITVYGNYENGKLTLQDSSTNKTAEQGSVTGGTVSGIKVSGAKGTLVMNSGNIAGNGTNASARGGGVSITGGTFEMNNGSIHNNFTKADGAGVHVQNNGTFTMNGGSISNNATISANGYGGGVGLMDGTFIMENGIISGNTTGYRGGGVGVNAGTFTMRGGSIEGNSSKDGGAVNVDTKDASFKMEGGKITENTATNGGGAVLVVQGTFEMQGGSVTGNTAKTGGAVQIASGNMGTVKLSGGEVSGNTADLGNLLFVDGHGGTAKIELGNLTYSLAYKTGEADEETGEETRIVTITVTDSEGNQIGDLAKTVNLLKSAAKFAVTDSNLRIELSEDMIDTTVTSTYGHGGYVDSTGFHPYPAPVVPSDPGTGDNATIDDTDVPTDEAPDETEIADPVVPLAAGPVTRAEFIDYLWRHEGEPASDGVCTFTDVPEDHEYVLALAWAEQNKVAFAYDDGTFEPDELITVGAAREFLDNFAKIFGTNAVAAADLKSLTGADDEAVLNCDEVLAEFFGA